VNAGNVIEALRVADGIIVSSAFKAVSGFTRESIQADWVAEMIAEFMRAVREPEL
jgi:predicted TIM-barrel enzyme